MISKLKRLWRRKKTIDRLIAELEAEYPLPADNLETLGRIADDYDINIYFCEAAILPLCSYKRDWQGKKSMVLPLCNLDGVISNCAHELGHLLLESYSEAEAVYFAWQIQKAGFLREHLLSVKQSWLHIAEVYQEQRDDPAFMEESFRYLGEQGAPLYLVNAVRADAQKILKMIVKD